MAHSATISIITPVYNSTDVLNETVESVLAQTFTNYEWIIVDDGSTAPQTARLLDKLQKTVSCVTIVTHDHNKGLPAARNTGIRQSTAPYLFFLDGDDLIDPTFLEKAYLCLHQNEAFAFVNSYVVGFGAQAYKWTGGFHERETFLQENRNTSCFMARRSVFKQVLFDETMRDGCEDWDFWLHAASKGFWGYTIPEYLFYYRRSEQNKWQTLQGKKALMGIQRSLNEKYTALQQQPFPNPQFSQYTFGYLPAAIDVKQQTTPQHILLLLPWLEIGGADQYNLNLMRGLKAKGWTFTVITTLPSSHPWEPLFKELTTDIFHFAHLGTEVIYAALLAYFIKSRGPHCVFLSNSMYGYYIIPYIKQLFPKLPVVDYLHCEDIGWYGGGYPRFSALYNELLDKTFTTSLSLSRWCVANGAGSENMEVCYINVDTAAIKRDEKNRQQLRAELGVDEKVPVILYVARLTHQKQPQVFINTIEALHKKGALFQAIVIGDGPDRPVVEQGIAQKGLSTKILYLGSRTNEQVLQWMDAGDLFFLPSLYEGIALSVYEAMAKGLAVVGADVGGQAELVTEACGVLIKPVDVVQDTLRYTEILAQLLQNPMQIRELGRNGRHRVEAHFDLKRMIDLMHNELLAVQATERSHATFSKPHIALVNEMYALKAENEVLLEQTNSRTFRLMNRYKRHYHRARAAYHKLKKGLKKQGL